MNTVNEIQVQRFLERFICEDDPEVREQDSSCIECTMGTVPKARERGLCVYHEACFLLDKLRRSTTQ